MSTQVITGIVQGSAESAAATVVAEIDRQLGQEVPVLVLLFASTSQPLSVLAPTVAEHYPTATVLGCSTAGEFTQDGVHKNSTSYFALAGAFKIAAGLGRNLHHNCMAAVQQALQDQPAAVEGYGYRSAIMLLDPLAGRSEEAVMVTATLLGEGVPLAGGAAGDDLKMAETHVSLGAETTSDAVVVASIYSKQPLGVGVCHGHKPLSQPLTITRAEGNLVHEIDGRPAWQVWKEQTQEHAATANVDLDRLAPEEEGAFLLRYEAGLATGDEYKIRAPLSRTKSGSISFACGIPQGTVFQITESEPQRQVTSARVAAQRARAQTGGAPIGGALVFDCICRNLILDEEFSRAVNGIAEELDHMPIAGFETYGEIALESGSLSGFHNTTTVVLTFPQGED